MNTDSDTAGIYPAEKRWGTHIELLGNRIAAYYSAHKSFKNLLTDWLRTVVVVKPSRDHRWPYHISDPDTLEDLRHFLTAIRNVNKELRDEVYHTLKQIRKCHKEGTVRDEWVKEKAKECDDHHSYLWDRMEERYLYQRLIQEKLVKWNPARAKVRQASDAKQETQVDSAILRAMKGREELNSEDQEKSDEGDTSSGEYSPGSKPLLARTDEKGTSSEELELPFALKKPPSPGPAGSNTEEKGTEIPEELAFERRSLIRRTPVVPVKEGGDEKKSESEFPIRPSRVANPTVPPAPQPQPAQSRSTSETKLDIPEEAAFQRSRLVPRTPVQPVKEPEDGYESETY